MNRIVLAYSGGLDTTVAIAWLKEQHAAEVVAVTLDLGQGDELEAIRNRALAAGASRAHVLDVREEFATGYMLPALKADAIREDGESMTAALGRPLIAEKLVAIARIERADGVAHGGMADSTDQAGLDAMIRDLDPSMRVLTPAREWGMTRSEEIEYAGARGIVVPPAVDSRHHTLTKSPAECPDEPAYVEITFEHGAPTALNGVPMPFVELIAILGAIAAAHGVGAAAVLHATHQELQTLVMASDLADSCRTVSAQYADIIRHGRWFLPMRDALDAFVEKVQDAVTGIVRMKFFKGACVIVACKSANAVYDRAPAACDGVDANRSATTDS